MVKSYIINIKNKLERVDVVVATYFSLIIMFLFNPLSNMDISVTEFNRVIGMGIASGVDCQKVIKNFYVWFAIFIISFIVISLVISLLRRKKILFKTLEVNKSVERLVIIALFDLLFFGMNYFENSDAKETWSVSNIILLVYILFYTAYDAFKLDECVDLDTYKMIMVENVAMSFAFAALSKASWQSGRTWVVIQLALQAILIVIIKLNNKINFKKFDLKRIAASISHFSWIYLFTAVYLETVNVLNQYNVFIHRPRRIYAIAFLIFVVIGIAKYGVFINKEIKSNVNIYYPIILIGVACLAVQLGLQFGVGYDWFESSNYSVLIGDFFNNNSIPIVEHYGGHMLSNVLGGILYGVINADYYGALFVPYARYIYPIIVLIFYLVLKNLLESEYSFWIAFTFPFYNFVSYWFWGISVCFALVNYLKKKTYKSAFLIWICCAIISLYMLDVGVAFDVAILCTIIVYAIKENNIKIVKQTSSTLVATLILCGICFCILCLMANVNPVERLREFISISASNQNWAYGTLGDMSKIAYAFTYLFLPVVVLMGLVYAIFSDSLKQRTNNCTYVLLLTLGFAFFANYPRALVRHSNVEMLMGQMILSGYMFIIVLLVAKIPKNYIFLLALSGCIIINAFLTGGYNVEEKGLVDKYASNVGQILDSWKSNDGEPTFWWGTNEKVERVILSDEIKQVTSERGKICEMFLDEDDTYLDLVNNASIYPLVNRRCPVYVSQTPGQLSGEYTQEMFINEIEKNKNNIPIALLPTSDSEDHSIQLDGILNTYRYYKVFEYVYQNYKPLCLVGTTQVWCRNELYDEYCGIIDKKEILSYNKNDKVDMLDQYNIGQIPYLWAQYDSQNAIENKMLDKLQEQNSGIYTFNCSIDDLEKKFGNYILLNAVLTDENYNQNTISMGKYDGEKFTTCYTYTFTMMEGQNNYIFRVSSNYNWYSSDINAVKVGNVESLENVQIQLVDGGDDGKK